MEDTLHIIGILSCLLSGYFYGKRADDIPFGQAFLVGIGSYLMNFMVYGALLTVAWLAAMPFGFHIGFSQPLHSFAGFWLLHFGIFLVIYAVARPLRLRAIRQRT